MTYSDKLKTILAVEMARPEMDVLDIGVGIGRVMVPLSRTCRSITGIDNDPDTLDRLAPKLGPAGKLVLADAHDLPFDDAAFDLCFFYSTLCLLRSPEKALSEVRRVLRPDGIAVIEVHGTRNANTRFWKADYERRGHAFNSYQYRDARGLVAQRGFRIDKTIANGWTRGHLYMPVLRRIKAISPLMHSGEPDADHVLSNIWPMTRFASSWHFIATAV